LTDPAATLTIIICREQTDNTAIQPRIVRFLMELAPSGPTPPPATPRTL
jgi:hypothetical protein